MLEIVPIEEIPVANEVLLDSPPKILKVARELESLCRKENGMGISAVQAGIPWKLFLILYPNGSFRYFVNCKYSPIGEDKIPKTLEGCLSLPGRFFSIENHRWEKVAINGYELVIEDREPKISKVEFEVKSSEYSDSILAGSVVFQHEIDHQMGKSGLISNINTSKEVNLNR